MHQSVLSLCCANGCTSYVVEVSVVLQAQFIILLMDFCVAISRVHNIDVRREGAEEWVGYSGLLANPLFKRIQIL